MDAINRLMGNARRKFERNVAIDAAQLIDVAKPVVEHADAVFRTPVVEVDESTRERERIVPPLSAGPFGNSYKMLRTQVLRRLSHIGSSSLAILSPTEGAGKTLTAINLAIAIAADSAKTALLVDLDLRRPSVAKRFGLDVQVGIDDCLLTGRPIQDALVKIAGYDRLTILPARERHEHSAELLAGRRCAELMTELRNRYANRILIVDLPPVLQADDALALSTQLHTGLLVVGEGRSRRDDVARSLELLSDVTIVGTVLNGSRESVDRCY